MEGLSSQDHETLSLTNTNIFEIKNNDISYSRMGAIIAKNGNSNGKIYGNQIHDTSGGAVYIDGWNLGASNIDIYKNIIYRIEGEPSGAISISSEKVGTVDNIKLYNNIIYDISSNGIAIPWYTQGQIKNVLIINNNIYNSV